MYFLFCESVYLDTMQENETNNKFFRKRCPEWITTKAEFFKNAEKRCERTKNEYFWKRYINNPQKREMWTKRNAYFSMHFVLMWTDKNEDISLRFFIKFEGCGRELRHRKTDNNKNRLVWTGRGRGLSQNKELSLSLFN